MTIKNRPIKHCRDAKKKGAVNSRLCSFLSDGRDAESEPPPVRFLVADEARAGKSIMAGLFIPEMLVRRGNRMRSAKR